MENRFEKPILSSPYRCDWSRNILVIQIETRFHERHGKAVSNFPAVLPPADSDMAAQIFKVPYVFDFLDTADPQITKSLPDELKSSLPTIEKIETELGGDRV